MRNPFRSSDKQKAGLTITPAAQAAIDLGLTFDDSIAIPLFDGASSTYAKLYRRQPAVRSVVDFLARNIAQVGLKVYERQGAVSEYRPDHPCQRLLNRPADGLARSRFMRQVVADVLVYDRALVLKVKQDDKLALVRVPMPEVEVSELSFTGPQKFTIGRGNAAVTAGPTDVIYLHGYSPTDNAAGVAPMETLRQILAEETAAGTDRERFWRNGNRGAGFYERSLDTIDAVGPEAVAAWEAAMREKTRGERGAGNSPLLPPGFTFKDTRIDADTAEYIGTRRLAREEVARAYGVPLPVLGLMDTSNWGVDQFHQMLYQECLAPWCVWLQEEFEQQLLYVDFERTGEASGFYLDFNLAEKLNGSPLDQAKLVQQIVGRPIWTADEARGKIYNLPPLPNGAGEDIFINGALVAAGGPQASPTDVTNQSDAQAKALAIKVAGERGRDQSATDHAEAYRRLFTRMKAVVLSSKAAGDQIDVERWTRELYDDIRPLATSTVKAAGITAALNYGGSFDPAYTVHWLDANTRNHARGVIRQTAQTILEADDLNAYFDRQIVQRVPLLAGMRATSLVGFATNEAAKQSNKVSKTWIVTSANPRPTHAQLSGETVSIEATFSNGAAYPCDEQLPVEEAAGCSCMLAYG